VRLGALTALAALLLIGCGANERPPGLSDGIFPDASSNPDGFEPNLDTRTDTAINCSAGEDAGICACSEIGQKPTTLYLVLDRSGSMLATDGGTQTRWDTIILALLHAKTGVLRKLGSRVAVGLALFPGMKAGGDECTPGAQALAPTVGSVAAYDQLAKILSASKPTTGATPTAATLVSLAPTIKAFAKPAFVLLATDGAPNCGTASCGIERCTYNVESAPLTGGGYCDATINCCDPTKVSGGMGWRACIDADATKAAVAELAAAGVKTFVFGVPGTGPYAADLDELARAGGTAREDAVAGEPLYYAAKATTQEDFTSALSAVAAKAIDTCVITLESVPSDPGITNVLLDGVLVAQDPVDGWAWIDGSTVELRGTTCERVKSGSVSRVQVAVGCKTVTK